MDHVLCVSIQARQLLLSFHGIRQMTPSSGLQSLPALMDSEDASPLSYTFLDTPLNYEASKPWPRVPGLEVLMDSGLNSLRKSIVKQFTQTPIPSETILKVYSRALSVAVARILCILTTTTITIEPRSPSTSCSKRPWARLRATGTPLRLF
jgi:hypothetical protein